MIMEYHKSEFTGDHFDHGFCSLISNHVKPAWPSSLRKLNSRFSFGFVSPKRERKKPKRIPWNDRNKCKRAKGFLHAVAKSCKFLIYILNILQYIYNTARLQNQIEKNQTYTWCSSSLSIYKALFMITTYASRVSGMPQVYRKKPQQPETLGDGGSLLGDGTLAFR